MSAIINDQKTKIKFHTKQDNDFLSVVRSRVDRYFKETGKSRHAPSSQKVKVICFLCAWITVYTTLLLQPFSPLYLLLLAGLLGVITGFFGVNLSHDAVHGSFSSNSFINNCLGYTYDMIGMSSLVWRMTHNGGHHTFTNIAGHDPDIDKPFLLRLAPQNKWRWFHRYQQFYIWLLYTLVSVNWIYLSDFLYLYQERKKVTFKNFALFLFFKVVSVFIFLGIPYLVINLPFWQILIGYLFLQGVGGFAVALVFQLAHLVENVEFPLPGEGGVMEHQWGEHEMRTTANFATSSNALNILLGGLNFQIEHHLFPYIAHGHYKTISPIVRQTAKEFNLPYVENPTLISAICSHFRVLKKLGSEPNSLRQPFK
jgi:linoleoyl-CoA desaturase